MKKILFFAVTMLISLVSFCQPPARGELFQRDSTLYKPKADKFQLMVHTNKKVLFWDNKKWNAFALSSDVTNFNPIAGTGMVLTGTYPNITFNATNATAITASNGLTRSGNDIKLGGRLTYCSTAIS